LFRENKKAFTGGPHKVRAFIVIAGVFGSPKNGTFVLSFFLFKITNQ